MLRLPLKKIYRAFPELDRFTDEQCERYLDRARREFRPLLWTLPLVSRIALFIFCIAVLSFTGGWLTEQLDAARTDWQVAFLGVGTLTFIVGVPLIGGLLVRDVILHTALRRHVRSKVERSRCPTCKYSLLGQRVSDDVIRCPECGGTTTVGALGLASAEDLIPPTTSGEPSHDASLKPRELQAP